MTTTTNHNADIAAFGTVQFIRDISAEAIKVQNIFDTLKLMEAVPRDMQEQYLTNSDAAIEDLQRALEKGISDLTEKCEEALEAHGEFDS